MKILKTTCYKGTVIRVGNEKWQLIQEITNYLIKLGYTAIEMPCVQYQETFADKVGTENNNLMFKFEDRKQRQICLAPEYTAVIQQLAKQDYRDEKDVRLFYVQQCFRGERSQKGRWREFTQLGVEWLNPTHPGNELVPFMATQATALVGLAGANYTINMDVVRGLDYYKDGKGFEIVDRQTGLQLCGGGEYDGGVGFAIGIDRLLILSGNRLFGFMELSLA